MATQIIGRVAAGQRLSSPAASRSGHGTTMALMIALAASAIAGAASAAPMAGDGPGCKDKAIAAKLIGLTDRRSPAYIEILGDGDREQDGSCRGYPIGQEVTVEDRADGMACVKAADDDACFWVREDMAPPQ